MTGNPARDARRAFRWRPAEPADGFTLIEVAVAMMIALILMIGLTISVGNTLRAVRHNRSLQQANALALERLEFARAIPWDNLAMANTALPTDPLLLDPVDRRLVGSEVDLPTDELLVEDTTDGWSDTYRTEVFDEQTFQVRTYVTEVDTGLRRVVAVVDWDIGDAQRQTFTSTLISEVTAG